MSKGWRRNGLLWHHPLQHLIIRYWLNVLTSLDDFFYSLPLKINAIQYVSFAMSAECSSAGGLKKALVIQISYKSILSPLSFKHCAVGDTLFVSPCQLVFNRKFRHNTDLCHNITSEKPRLPMAICFPPIYDLWATTHNFAKGRKYEKWLCLQVVVPYSKDPWPFAIHQFLPHSKVSSTISTTAYQC